MKHLAVYVRTSTDRQDLRSQQAELRRWLEVNAAELEVRWYSDQASGTTMARPGWQKLEAALRAGEVDRILVWRLDRLGRTSAGLTALFDELTRTGVALTSMREGFDLATPAGRMLATVLASVAQFETEVRRERQAAGIAAAKAQGVRWGGRRKGDRYKVDAEKEAAIRHLHAQRTPIAAIARTLQLSRSTVYATLRTEERATA